MSLRDRVRAFMHPNAMTHLAQPVRKDFAVPFAAQRGLRRGMWVTVTGGPTGILVGLDVTGVAQVQLLEDDGTNKVTIEKRPDGSQHLVPLIIPKAVTALRQAFLEEIPAPRRPDAETAARFGYVKKQSP